MRKPKMVTEHCDGELSQERDGDAPYPRHTHLPTPEGVQVTLDQFCAKLARKVKRMGWKPQLGTIIRVKDPNGLWCPITAVASTPNDDLAYETGMACMPAIQRRAGLTPAQARRVIRVADYGNPRSPLTKKLRKACGYDVR